MAAPQANEVRPRLRGSAPHGGRGQPHDGQCPTANERASRLALGSSPAVWAAPRRWDGVTDKRSTNRRVERTSGPVRDLRGRGSGFGAGTPRGAGTWRRVNSWPARSDPGGRFGWAARRPTTGWAGGSPQCSAGAPHPQCTGDGLGRAGVGRLRRAVGGTA